MNWSYWLSTVLDQYDQFIDTAQAIYDSGYPGTSELVEQSGALIWLDRAREQLSREDALITGVLSTHRPIARTDRARFAELVAGHRILLEYVPRDLPPADRTAIQTVLQNPEYTRFRVLEDKLVDGSDSVDVGAWHTASELT